MPNKDIFTVTQNLVEVYNTDIDEQLRNELIQFKNFYNEYQDRKDENISREKWMYKLLYVPFTCGYKQQRRKGLFKN